MQIIKIIFIVLALASVIFFVGAGYLGDSLNSISFLLGGAGETLQNTMTPEIAAFFGLAVITVIAAIVLL